MTATVQPHNCQICGNYLTTKDTHLGKRCLDPGHWQAAGLLTARDFYSMAQIVALARREGLRSAGRVGTAQVGAGL